MSVWISVHSEQSAEGVGDSLGETSTVPEGEEEQLGSYSSRSNHISVAVLTLYAWQQ